MAKRPDGALEAEILQVLWSAERSLLPAEVNERLGRALAYTSVATVLTRLHAKGLLRRDAVGRGYAYSAIVAESDLAARRINDLLAGSSDRTAVLARFVGALSARDARTLRRLLDGETR